MGGVALNQDVVSALAAIPNMSQTLGMLDDQLSKTIALVETKLNELRLGVPVTVTYKTADGCFALSYSKWNKEWRLAWGAEDDDSDDVNLLGAPRHVRAEIFIKDPATLESPIERLLIAIPRQLELYAAERKEALAAAERVVAALETARLKSG